MCRLSRGCCPAITATLVIGSVAQLVTAIMPQKWTILAPVIGIGFEVR